MLEGGSYSAAFWVFLVAALSDVADGFVAKRLNGCTPLGAALDPAADKLLIGAMFLVLGWQGSMPASLVALVIAREVMLIGGTVLLRYRLHAFRIEPHVVGKICTFVQLTLVGFVLARLGGVADATPVIEILVPLVAIFTAASALAYLGAGLRLDAAAGERKGRS
jgi:cardiolipin synthase